jgi:hypothetical protein
MGRVTIQGLEFELFIDYDRQSGNLQRLVYPGTVEYLEKRFEFAIINPLLATLADFGKDPDRFDLLIWGNALTCSIEALGHFLTNSAASGRSFDEFFKFMNPIWTNASTTKPQQYSTYRKWLWKSVRNGLAHAAYVKDGGFEFHATGNYIDESSGSIRVDPQCLLDDFVYAVKKFFIELNNPGSVYRAKFEAHFYNTFIIGR